MAVFLGLIVVFLAISIAPVDRTIDRQSLRNIMKGRIDTLRATGPEDTLTFSVGFAKESITPCHRTATAGYGTRRGKLFDTVHDSIFVRTLVVSNGARRVAIVSTDLLIVPPTVTLLLEQELSEVGFTLNNTYMGAIHSHNSIGNWAKGATALLYGPYNDSIVHFIVDKIKISIQRASQNMLPSTLKAGFIPVAAVANRLIDNGPVDPLLRVIEVHRSDSSRLALLSYTAHATCLPDDNLNLSRDYPGKLVDVLEQKKFTFAMFMAGAVGSHSGAAPEAGQGCVDWMSEKVSNDFLEHEGELTPLKGGALAMHRVPLLLSDPQVKVLKNWCLRPRVFESAFGEYDEYLTVLRLGDLVMLGTPCDFSGQFDATLDSVAHSHGLRAMVTSFNGGYIGYVTPERYYDVDHYETQLMNWYGKGNGEYMTQCMAELIEAVSR
ncbi:neutral/alkaline non-lysosomal ceramidase N-terminal domain-containing protein [Chryseolinea lacunae]|uniref:Neutral/alkaline non-lysosomal ceramidase N-terminal domain-containing protein n=1 Tax=Chryseolinea lacunae TaxID=2801331 RepID=A0ABS1KLI1_9BACT|nr:neutral/alkaline non-lysosomal ceramidase N-terminal domain-containing protein [Chryseolinea lacunae]MBL0740198.1 neutral/alkaline non-lysosomal ceramidase N-terminal domain-containing protein [Chryseolinea lacunae]